MPRETNPLPALAIRTIALLQAEFARRIDEVAADTLAVMGLSPSDGWRIDIEGRSAVRETPDAPEPA